MDNALVSQAATSPAPTGRRHARESYESLLSRLSDQSVKKHYDAYADIEWDAPHMQIDPRDPRWELDPDTGLGASDWYQALPQPTRAALGLHSITQATKLGLQFENVLQRGMLELAFKLPNRTPEFRYAYHEVIEEGHHTLMFQEFVNRTPFDPQGLDFWTRLATRFIVRLGRVFPELFLFFVLGGEEPIDHVQKQHLRSGRPMHPLQRRISQIHITEEARHLCFARSYLERHVPRLAWYQKLRLSVSVPVILSQMAAMMLQPSRQMIRQYNIPRSALRQAFHDNPGYRRTVADSLRGVGALCARLGLVDWRSAWLWRLLRLGDPRTRAGA